MPLMFATLDVSQLRGWLKANASCRVKGRACDAGRGVRAGRRGSKGRGTGASAAHGEDPRLRRTGRQGIHARREHMEHASHVFDARRVEAQGLVEGMSVLPSRRRACDAGRGVRRLGRGAAASACARVHTRRTHNCEGLGGRVTCAAIEHLEHFLHVRDAGRVNAQGLVEIIRVLPSRREDMRRGARCAVRKAGKQRAWGSGERIRRAHAEDPQL